MKLSDLIKKMDLQVKQRIKSLRAAAVATSSEKKQREYVQSKATFERSIEDSSNCPYYKNSSAKDISMSPRMISTQQGKKKKNVDIRGI